MTDLFNTESLLAAWMEAEAPPRAPDGLRDDILTATSRIRPRPAWLAQLKGNLMDLIMGGRAGRTSYQRLVPVLVALGLLLAIAIGALVVASRLQKQEPIVPISRVPFTEPLAQVIFGDDGTAWASTTTDGAGTFRITGIHRIDLEKGTSTPVVTDLPDGHTGFVVLDDVIWASNGEAGTWHSWNADTGAPLGTGDIGPQPLEPITAFGSVWQNLFGTIEVVRVNPTTGEMTRILLEDPGPRSLLEGAGRLWVFTPGKPIRGIDPATNKVAATLAPSHATCHGSVAGGRVWAFPCDALQLAEVFEPDGILAGTYRTDADPWFAFDYDGDVWSLETTREKRVFENDAFRTVPATTRAVRLDPATLKPLASYDLGEGVFIGESSDVVTGSLDSDFLWLAQGKDVIRIPLAALPERPGS
jgi:hypothetical protein